jgi:hypothetical protein
MKMSMQPPAAIDAPVPDSTFQRPALLRVVGATITGTAVASGLELVLLVFDTPWQSFILIAAAGLFLWQLVSAMLVLPLWDLSCRRGYRRWWQAILFGATAGLLVSLILIHETSGVALRFEGIIATGSAVSALIIWWIGYYPRG